MRPTRLLAPALVASLLPACSSQSRLWRLSPFAETKEESSERVNLWPLAFAAGGGASILWPLVDVDPNGFAVRPLVSHDRSDWDFLYPLSHFDSDSGNGWALNYYQVNHDLGLAPLFHFGPGFNYFLPAWWWVEDGHLKSGGVFPIAGTFGDWGYAGAVWWNGGGFGLFPILTWSQLKWIGPVWWNSTGPEGGASAGLFPLVWKWGDEPKLLVLPVYYGDRTRRAVVPFYYGEHDADHDLDVALVPPTWWSTQGDRESHVVFPFYARFKREEFDLDAWFPFCATKTTSAGWHWFSPIGDGWRENASAGLDLYPLWYSAHAADASRQMLLPFYYLRERGDDRLLLTPLGGRGWNERSGSRFLNVLGPVFHHSVGGDTETTAIAWPFYERERVGETTKVSSIPLFGTTSSPQGRDTWFLGGLGRSVSKGDANSFRLFPLVADSSATKSPDLLFDLTLAGARSRGGEWSRRLLPLFWASGDDRRRRSDGWTLGGLARSVDEPGAHSFRLFPIYAQSSGAQPPDPLFDFTLVGLHSNEDAWSGHLFPLYWGAGDGKESSQTALLGLGRIKTTERGSAWRLWPLASCSSDPAADGELDAITLFRRERTETARSERLIPLYFTSTRGEEHETDVLPPLIRSRESPQGRALRLWPLVTTSDGEGFDDGLDGLTLFGSHFRSGKSHVHIGTDAVFGFDRSGEGNRSWNAQLLTFCEFGHTERSDSEIEPELEEKRIAAENGDGATRRDPITVERDHAGFLFDWFLVERRAVLDEAGQRHDESHWRMPLVHEYRRTPAKKEWDLLCYAVHSTDTGDESRLSVLGYGYRSERKGDSTRRDIFPFVTWDTAPRSKHVSFLWRLFDYRRQGDRRGGHLLFIPWGDRADES